MKMEQIKLLEEASTYKLLVQDINEFSSHIQSRGESLSCCHLDISLALERFYKTAFLWMLIVHICSQQ